MPDINFGLLQHLVAQRGIPITQVDAETQPENYRANLSNDTQRMGILAQAGTAQAANSTAQQRNAQDYVIAQQQNATQAQQTAANAGFLNAEAAKQGVDTQQNQLNLTKDQQAFDIHNQAMDIYSKVAKDTNGDTEKALDAMQNFIISKDPDHGIKLMTDRQTLKKNNDDAAYEINKHIGDTLFGIHQSAADQGITDRDAMVRLIKANPNYIKEHPGAPDPDTYTDPATFNDAMVGAMSYGAQAGNQIDAQNAAQLEVYKAQQKQQQDEFAAKQALELEDRKAKNKTQSDIDVYNATGGTNATFQLQNKRDALVEKLPLVAKAKGANSSEVKAIANDIDELNRQIDDNAKANTWAGRLLPSTRSINSVTSSLSSPAQSNQVKSNQATSVPQGVTPEMIQQELLRRQGK